MSRAIRSDTLNGTDLRLILGSKATMTNEQYTEYQGRVQEFTSDYYREGAAYRNILYTLYNPQNQMMIGNQTDVFSTSHHLKSVYTAVRAHEAIEVNKGMVEDSLKTLHDMTKNLSDFEKGIQLYQLQRVVDGSMQASQIQNYYGNEKLTKKKAELLHQVHNNVNEIVQEMITTILDEMNGGSATQTKEFMTNYRNRGHLQNWDWEQMLTRFQNGNPDHIMSLLSASHINSREVFDSNTIDFIFSKDFLEPSLIFDSYMDSEALLYPYMGGQYHQNHTLELIMRVVYLSEIKKNNPQVKTLGITNLSAYNMQSYYFKEDVNQCRKKNTTFYDFTAFPSLSQTQMDNVKTLMESLKSKIMTKIDGEYAAFTKTQAVDMENFYKDAEQAQKIMVQYWKNMIQQAYKEKKEDYIAALYGNYLVGFPYQDYNIREWLGDYMTANPITEEMTHGAILNFYPQNYIAVSISYQGAYTNDEKFNQTINDFSENVKHEILSLGIPAYISAPLRQQFYDRRASIEQRYNGYLQGYATQIQQNENKRRQELDETNEALNKVFHGEYHFV